MSKAMSARTLAIGLALMAEAVLPFPSAGAEASPATGAIAISGAWALYPMAVRWAEEYKKLNPGVRIDISAGGAGKGMADCLSGMTDLGMVSRDVTPEEAAKGAMAIPVAVDAVAPVVNAKNPALPALLARGVKADEFKKIWTADAPPTWGWLIPAAGAAKIDVFTRSDACGAGETWAKYLGLRQEDLGGTGVYGDPGLASAVAKDPMAIGYNNIGFIFDHKTGREVDGLKILPIDINGDGQITPDEDFYASRGALAKAIADGRFPSPPSRHLFFVSKGFPAKPEVKAFLLWTLGDGQRLVPEAGYVAAGAKGEAAREMLEKGK